jgi:hypothetical protein
VASETTRRVVIPRERLSRWLSGFAERHGRPETLINSDVCVLVAPDGAEARISIPFGPLAADDHPALDRLVDHVRADRRVGAVLVRRGGFAVGVFNGRELINSKVGSSYVQSRTKAGGWSQQRYARRRGNQARQLYDRAAEAVVSVLLPVVDDLVAVVGGGDHAGIEATLDGARLTKIKDLLLPRIYPTEDPRLRVLEAFPDQFLAITVELNDLA